MNNVKTIKGLFNSFFTFGIICLFCNLSELSAQYNPILTVKGGTFYLKDSVVVSVYGDMLNQVPVNDNDNLPAMRVSQLALLDIHGSFINNYKCGQPPVVDNNGNLLFSAMYNDGTIIVKDDWVNNDTFWGGTASGNVILSSVDPQLITGTHPTTFNILSLDSAGVKTQTLNAVVTKRLILGNSQLNTDLYKMSVTNAVASSVDWITGFVSTNTNANNSIYGRLERLTNNSGANYVFPMGQDVNGTIHRRYASLAPNSSDSTVYDVSFFYEQPINYGFSHLEYDTSAICVVGKDYFFNITRESGIANSDITLTYDPSEDPIYTGIVNWRTFPAPTEWKNPGGPFPNTTVTSIAGDQPGVTKVGNYDWNTVHKRYGLGWVRPATPQITGANTLCGSFDTLYTVLNPTPNTTFAWNVTPGVGIFQGDSAGNPVSVAWLDTSVTSFDPTQGTITVLETLGSCSSLPGTLVVNILSNPIPSFTVVTPYSNGILNPAYGDTTQIFTFDMLQFQNTSQNSVAWSWDFANGNTSILESPYQQYDTIGTYPIQMIATSPDGCVDTANGVVNVVQGTTIPNVFTPNNDGVNDVFLIRNSNVQSYDLQIYNRWGTLVYKATAPQIKWDGNTISGQPASPGTYFWVIQAKYYDSTEYTGAKNGYVELVRAE